MIRDAKTAKLTLALMTEAHKLLMDSLAVVKSNCSQEEYKAYEMGMGHVLGRLYFLLMEPTYCQHPSLAPPDTPSDFINDYWAKNKLLVRPKADTE